MVSTHRIVASEDVSMTKHRKPNFSVTIITKGKLGSIKINGFDCNDVTTWEEDDCLVDNGFT